MNQINSLNGLSSHSLYCFSIKGTVLAKDNSSLIIRNIIDHNLKSVSSEVFSLRLKNPGHDSLKERVHAIKIALKAARLEPDFFILHTIQIVAATAGILVVGAVFITGIIIIPFAASYLLFKASQYEGLDLLILLIYTGLISYLNNYVEKVIDFTWPYFRDCKQLFQTGIEAYRYMFSEFISTCKKIPKEYLLTRQSSSCSNLEFESILNLKNSDNKLFDPITNTYFDFEANSPAFIRIGRYVLPIRSFIECLIKSNASNLNEVIHPFLQNRFLSHDEIEQLSTDFLNFFSCDLKVMNEILSISMPPMIRENFPDTNMVSQHIKAKIFSIYISKGHSHFSPLKLTRSESYEYLTSIQKDNIHAAFTQISVNNLGIKLDH